MNTLYKNNIRYMEVINVLHSSSSLGLASMFADHLNAQNDIEMMRMETSLDLHTNSSKDKLNRISNDDCLLMGDNNCSQKN